MKTDPFSHTRLLLGDDGMARLAASRMAVFGLGGVGGSAVEAWAWPSPPRWCGRWWGKGINERYTFGSEYV